MARRYGGFNVWNPAGIGPEDDDDGEVGFNVWNPNAHRAVRDEVTASEDLPGDPASLLDSEVAHSEQEEPIQPPILPPAARR